jgi:RimJ/RimL family protein N-acetyltransferase
MSSQTPPENHQTRPIANWHERPAPGGTPLKGRFVRLEPLSAARHGAQLYAENAGDVPMWDYMSYGPFADEADYLAWIASVEGKKDPMYFAILDMAGRARGVASYLRIDRANGVAEVGHIALSPGLQRSSAATEAMFLMADHIFALGYRRYEWKCNAANLPSRRAAERYGFSYEGTFRNHMVMKGRNRDTAWFAMTDEDWPALRGAHQHWLAAENFDAAGGQLAPLSALTRPLLRSRDPV